MLEKHVGLFATIAELIATGPHFQEIVGKDGPFEWHKKPANRGQLAKKDAEALQKAEAKRKRKAERRIIHNAKLRSGPA